MQESNSPAGQGTEGEGQRARGSSAEGKAPKEGPGVGRSVPAGEKAPGRRAIESRELHQAGRDQAGRNQAGWSSQGDFIEEGEGVWRRRGSRELPHLGPRRRALGRRLGPRSPGTARQYHEPGRVARRGLHQGRLHRRGAQVDAESDRSCSHDSVRAGTLYPGPRRRGEPSPPNLSSHAQHTEFSPSHWLRRAEFRALRATGPSYRRSRGEDGT